MADEKRKVWVIPAFFGILVALVWIILATMEPSKAEGPVPAAEDGPADGAEALSATAGTAEAVSSTVR